MKGETLQWFKLADRLGLSLSETMERTTSRQFILWIEYLRKDVNDFHREDYFLAQISMDIRRLFKTRQQALRHQMKGSLLKFELAKGKVPIEQEGERIGGEKLRNQKRFFLNAVGLFGDKAPEDL